MRLDPTANWIHLLLSESAAASRVTLSGTTADRKPQGAQRKKLFPLPPFILAESQLQNLKVKCRRAVVLRGTNLIKYKFLDEINKRRGEERRKDR